MKIIYLSLFLVLTIVAIAKGQSTIWKINVGKKILHSMISKDGLHLLSIYEDDNNITHAACVNVTRGAILWERTLVDFEEYSICHFINNDTIMLGQKQQYEFIATESGKLLKVLPIISESWSNLKNITAQKNQDDIKPYFKDDIAIIYFYEGFQILDLKKLEIAYQTTESPTELKYYEWDDVLFFNFIGGSDSLYFFDQKIKKIIYKMSLDDFPINSSIYQPFVLNGRELLIFNEENIQSINLENGELNATIEVDPDYIDSYIPVILKGGLYLMISHKDRQFFYQTKNGKMLWQTEEKVFPGIVEQVVEIPDNDGQGIIFSYKEDGKMMLHSINLNSGAIAWEKILFVQDGEYEPGHKQGNKTIGVIGEILSTKNTSYKYEYSYMHKQYVTESYHDIGDDPYPFYNSWVNRKKRSKGYASMLFIDKNQIVVSTAGLIWKPENEQQDEYDGEGVWTMNLSDGSITKSQSCVFFDKSDINNINAIDEIQKKELNLIKAKILIGINDIYVAKQDRLDHFSFNEGKLKLITNTTTDIVIIVDNDSNSYDYWRINTAASPAEQLLIARSTHKNIKFSNTNTYIQNYINSSRVTLNITSTDISAYDRKVGPVNSSTFSSSQWKITSNELDSLGVGSFTDIDNFFNHIQEIFLLGDQFVIVSRNAIYTISKDGKCRWSHEWSPNRYPIRMGLLINEYKAMYVIGDKVTILKNTCEGGVVAEHEIDASDIQILKAEENPTCVVIVDTDEGILRGYSLLK